VLSREAEWSFPSSAGRPVGGDAGEWVDELLEQRHALTEAAAALIDRGDDAAAVELAANAWRIWVVARDVAGGRAFLGAVLGRADPAQTRDRALALYGDGLLAYWQGAHEESRHSNESALEAARAAGDPEALALAHLGLSRVAVDDGHYERGRELAVAAREHARGLGPAMGQAPLHLHAQSTRLAGDYDGAADLFRESLDLNREIGDDGMVCVELHNLGHVEIHRDNAEEAERLFSELTRISSADDPYSAAMSSLNGAAIAYTRGDDAGASALLERAESTLREARIPAAADDRFELDWLRERLSEAR
jgi:tetratricopeptide (TPR) repeat protein